MTNVTIGTSTCCSTLVSIVKPDGTNLFNPQYVGTNGGFIDVQTLPSSGSYTVLVDPQGTATGSATVTLYNVPPDATMPITPGGAGVSATTTTPGQNARFTFSATANQRVSFTVSSVTIGASTCCSLLASIVKPDGTNLFNPQYIGTNGGFVDVQTLPVDGSYTVLIDPQDAATGSATVTLYNVPADVAAPIAAGGAAVTATITVPGQNAQLTFSGTQGQRVSVQLTNVTIGPSTCCSTQANIKKPDGTNLTNPQYVGLTSNGSTSGGFIDTVTLPVAGMYTILVDPQSSSMGSATVTLYTVPADASASASIGGAAVIVTTTVPGQNAQVTFSGNAGQPLTLTMSNVTMGPSTCCSTQVNVKNPDGTNLTNPSYVGMTSNGTTFGSPIKTTLPTTGTYTVFIDPQDTSTGSMTVALTQTVSLIPNASPLNALLTDSLDGDRVAARTGEKAAEGRYLVASVDPKSADTRLGAALASDALATPATGTATPTPSPTPTATATATAQASATATPTASATPAASPTPTASPVPPRSANAAPGPAPQVPAIGGPDPRDKEDVWQPDAKNLQGDWKLHNAEPPDRVIPMRQAPAGVTAVSGEVLTIHGKPLENVMLSIGSVTARTDQTGRFLLTGVPAGHQELVVDATDPEKGHGNRSYGVYEDGIDVKGGETNVLPYTIWLTKIDQRHAVKIDSPTKSAVVVTTPLIPGLEVHIPAGTAFHGLNGEVETEISITPVPVDRPPFPVPEGEHMQGHVPVYFTIQPGGSSIMPDGVTIVYPNLTREAPGSKIEFWDYDPASKGWFVYGTGTVTADGKQVVPDPGVDIDELTGAMIIVYGMPPPPPILKCIFVPCNNGDPINVATGYFVYQKTDLALPDVLPVTLTRTHRQGDSGTRPFGIGATHPYAMYLWSAQQYQQADIIMPDGTRIHYVRTSPGTGFTDAVFQNTTTPGPFYDSQMKWNGDGWDITLKDGTAYVFGENQPLQAIRDRYGNQVTITHANGQAGNITQVTSPSGRWITFSYDANNRITQATDNAGRTTAYTYDTGGRLATETDPNGGVTAYTYDANNEMLTIQDPRGIVYLTNQYDSNGRVSRQTLADQGVYQFAYTLDGNGNVTQTDVTDPRSNVQRSTFTSDGYVLTDIRGLGTPQQQTTSYQWQAGSNLLLSKTDPLGRTTAYTYDPAGNNRTIVRLAGTSNAVTTTLTYEPLFNQVTSITDPLGHATAFSYDSYGSMISITDSLSKSTNLTYNMSGQTTSVTDPMNNTSRYSYIAGDLSSLTDETGAVTSEFTNGAGEVIATRDSFGSTTRKGFTPLAEPSQVVDSRSGATSLTYDRNGNPISAADPLQHATSFSYDNMDRLTGRTDALQRSESWQYDHVGNLTQYTDRKGQIAGITYDPINRPNVVTYSGGRTITYTYDAASRVTQLVDSVSGAISRTYDGLDRLTNETTPQGSVAYVYDNAGRRTSMTVAGQPSVNYTYDSDNRLTQITQGASTVGMSYDDAGRRTLLTLPNGITVQYTYDAASRITSQAYNKGGTSLGNLTYSYDAAGRRVAMGGSFARTGLPQAVGTATYDAANQLTQWGSSTFTYDANGNMANDGTKTYGWDTRNQLVSMTGGATASFQYDALGRRAQKTVNGATTGYLYDLANPVQELSSGAPSANLLTGLKVDQYFTRTDSGGTATLLTDALDSTLALTDANGAVQTQYTYDPFGVATASGPASSSSYQFTGRENDGIGIDYFRARYYNPQIERFISQDPLLCNMTHTFPFWVMADDPQALDAYTYVDNSPTNAEDPMGLEKDCTYYDRVCTSSYSSLNPLVIAYYCYIAPYVCKQEPDTPKGPHCTRRCLKDVDQRVCHSVIFGRKTALSTLVCTEIGAHLGCLTFCFADTRDVPARFGW